MGQSATWTRRKLGNLAAQEKIPKSVTVMTSTIFHWTHDQDCSTKDTNEPSHHYSNYLALILLQKPQTTEPLRNG